MTEKINDSPSNQPAKKSALRRLLIPILFYALIFLFLALYIKRTDFSQLSGMHLSLPYALLATILALWFRYWGAYVWFVLLTGLGASGLEQYRRQLLYVYAKTWLGRYIPGAVPWLLGKLYFASKLGLSKQKIAASALLEGVLQVLAALVVGLGLLAADPRLGVITPEMRWLLVGMLVVCIIAIIPWVFNRLLATAARILRKNTLAKEHFADSRTVVKGTLLYIAGTLVSGVAFFLITKAIYADVDFSDLIFIIGASSLASAAGMLVVVVPSGIGVRESVQILLLTAVMPAEVAVIVAVVMRLWNVVVDFAFFGMTKAFASLRRR